MHTLGTEVCSSKVFRDAIKPARFDALETAVAFDKFLSAEVYWSIVVSEDDTSAATNYDSTNEEREEKKEKSG